MLELHLFGAPDLRRAGEGPILPVLTGPKRLALLARLALQGSGTFVRRDRLLALLWPEAEARRARGALRNLLYQLRRDVGDGVIAGRGREEVGVADGTMRCDVWRFRDAIEREAWGEAVEEYRGELLSGYHLPRGSPEFERWLDRTRASLHRRAVDAASRVVQEAKAAGELERAIRWARRVVELAPTDVRAGRQLVELLLDLDRAVDAQLAFDAFAARLRDRLDMEPPSDLRRAVELRAARSTGSRAADGRRQGTGISTAGTDREDVDGAAARTRTPRASELAVPTIAVLPFRDLSPAADQIHLADGLAEEIINALTQLEALRVAARSSSFTYRGDDKDVRTIGDELGVGHVLEGSLRKTGPRIRLTAQLIDTRDGFHVWSETYDRELSDVFLIQEEIARSVVEALSIELLSGEEERLRRIEDVDPRAYELFLRGRDYWNRRHQVGLAIALDQFEQALERDPEFALALDGLAYGLVALAAYGLVSPDSVRDRALAASRQAVDLDPDLPEAHTTLGVARLLFEYDWEGALAEFSRAVELDGTHARAHAWKGLYATLRAAGPTGRLPDASLRAVDLEPHSEWVRTTVGHTFVAAGAYDEALEQHDRALEIEPESVPALIGRGAVRTAKGLHDGALEDLDTACSLTNRAPMFVALRGGAAARAGRPDEAEAALQELQDAREVRYVDPIMEGMVEAPLGEEETALQRVASSVDGRSPCLLGAFLMPPFEPLWDHVRWREILEPAGFELGWRDPGG